MFDVERLGFGHRADDRVKRFPMSERMHAVNPVREPDDFVASATLAVPRAVKRGEDVAFVFRWKLRPIVEAKIQRRRMTLDEDIRHEDFAG